MNQLILDFAICLWIIMPAAFFTSIFYVRKEKDKAVLYLVAGFGFSFLISPVISEWCKNFAITTVNGEYILVLIGFFMYLFYFIPFMKKRKH